MVKQDKAYGRHTSGDPWPDASRDKEAEHAAEAFQPEVVAEAAFDQPRYQ